MPQNASRPIDIGDEDHDRILAGLADAKAILDGAGADSGHRLHRVRVPDRIDVKRIRAATGLSQAAFASRYGFSPGAVRDWEQARKAPERANRLLLTIIERRPDVLDELMA